MTRLMRHKRGGDNVILAVGLEIKDKITRINKYWKCKSLDTQAFHMTESILESDITCSSLHWRV